jgi:hypothetical protein
MIFKYFADTNVTTYNLSAYPNNESLGDIITSSKLSHYDTTLSVAF